MGYLGQVGRRAMPVSEIEVDNRSAASVDVSEITLVYSNISTQFLPYIHTYIHIGNR